MQFIKDTTDNVHLITGIDEGAVRINDDVVTGSVVLSAERVLPWTVHTVASLGDTDWEPILEQHPEIILLGTGDRLLFPEPDQLKAAYQRQVGVEVMDTEAACRTYNLLVHEGRKVVAALIFPDTQS